MLIEKEPYNAPETEIFDVTQEGQIMQMSRIPDYSNGGDPLNS